jgi:ADP-heptose:LPS heptosyltransferase
VESLTANPEDLPLLKLDIREFKETLPVFIPQEREIIRVRELLKDEFKGKGNGPIVLLNPNASDMLPLRKWPTERFVALGKMILAHYPEACLAITGAPSERVSAEEVSRQIDSARVASFAGKTTLRELLVLYSLADILVTNDSGPGHFASLTPINSIVMYGPETPALFGAIGGRFQVIHPQLACSPCVNVFNHRFSPCRNNLCMQSISVDDVYRKVQACLLEAGKQG